MLALQIMWQGEGAAVWQAAAQEARSSAPGGQLLMTILYAYSLVPTMTWTATEAGTRQECHDA